MSTVAKKAAGPTREMRAGQALTLLNEALQIIDDLGNRPEVGARLQHVIDSLSDDADMPPAHTVQLGPIQVATRT